MIKSHNGKAVIFSKVEGEANLSVEGFSMEYAVNNAQLIVYN